MESDGDEAGLAAREEEGYWTREVDEDVGVSEFEEIAGRNEEEANDRVIHDITKHCPYLEPDNQRWKDHWVGRKEGGEKEDSESEEIVGVAQTAGISRRRVGVALFTPEGDKVDLADSDWDQVE